MSKYIDAEKLLEKEKALLKRLMAFRNALAGEEAKCADARYSGTPCGKTMEVQTL